MINYKCYITTFTKTANTKIGINTYANKLIPFLYLTGYIITRCLYYYMSLLHITWSRNFLKLQCATFNKTITTNLGGIIYEIERAAYPCMTWPNHAQVIKANTSIVAEFTHLKRLLDFWLYYILENKQSISNFHKSCYASHLIEKTTENNIFIVRFKTYMINAAS